MLYTHTTYISVVLSYFHLLPVLPKRVKRLTRASEICRQPVSFRIVHAGRIGGVEENSWVKMSRNCSRINVQYLTGLAVHWENIWKYCFSMEDKFVLLGICLESLEEFLQQCVVHIQDIQGPMDYSSQLQTGIMKMRHCCKARYIKRKMNPGTMKPKRRDGRTRTNHLQPAQALWLVVFSCCFYLVISINRKTFWLRIPCPVLRRPKRPRC